MFLPFQLCISPTISFWCFAGEIHFPLVETCSWTTVSAWLQCLYFCFKCLHQMSITKTNSEYISWSFSHVMLFFHSTCWCFCGVYIGQLYGLEKFWAFLKYAKVKNQPIDPKLQEYLSKFKSIDDFRVDVSIGIIPCEGKWGFESRIWY